MEITPGAWYPKRNQLHWPEMTNDFARRKTPCTHTAATYIIDNGQL